MVAKLHLLTSPGLRMTRCESSTPRTGWSSAGSDRVSRVCGIPITYETSEEFRNKRIVLLSLPGTFCSDTRVTLVGLAAY